MGGILGAMLGESPSEAAARVEEAKKTATDLTGIVRKKAKKEPVPDANPVSEDGVNTNGNGSSKRKAEDDSEASESKKVKIVEPEKAKVEEVNVAE
jgi:HAT1-interacting factor 1